MTISNKKQLSNESLKIINSKPANWAILLFGQALGELLDVNRVDIEANLKTAAAAMAGNPKLINYSEISDQVEIIKFHLHEISKVISELDSLSVAKDSVIGRASTRNDHESIIELAKKWANNYYQIALHGEVCRISKNAYEEYFKKNVIADVTWVLVGSITIVKGYAYVYDLAIRMVDFFNNVSPYLKAKFGPDSNNGGSIKKLAIESSNDSDIFNKLVALTIELMNIEEDRKKSGNPFFVFDNLKSISEATSIRKNEVVRIHDSPIQILNWMIDKKTFLLSELGKKLLHLDMFPSAFINEINEKSLDATGELALEEKNDNVIVQTKLLNQVIESWS